MMELYAINMETLRTETARLYDAHKAGSLSCIFGPYII